MKGTSGFPATGFGRNVIIFGVDMSSSANIDNKKKISFNCWWRSYTRIRWYNTDCWKICSTNFTEHNKNFCLSLHCDGVNSYLFATGTKIIKFNAKDSEIVATPLFLGNISKDFSVDNMKKTGFYGYVLIFMLLQLMTF